MTPSRALEILRKRAVELGFDDLAVAAAALPEPAAARYTEWLDAGCHADMSYLARRRDNQLTLADLLPGCRHVLVLAANYCQPLPGDVPAGSGRLAMYAGTRDYHKVLRRPANRLVELIETELGGRARAFVDTGPLSERSYAVAAGLGFIGRNSLLITPTMGSWVFLAVVLTDLELPVTAAPAPDRCGDCRRCVEACPTGAILENRSIDARRCLSYLTIENRGSIPEEFRAAAGNRLFGCDACQLVCPLNRQSKETKLSDFCERRFPGNCLDLAAVLQLDSDAAFRERFAGTPLLRAKRAGLQRNACVAAGNIGLIELLPVVSELSEQASDPVVCEAAAWACGKLSSAASAPANTAKTSSGRAGATKMS